MATSLTAAQIGKIATKMGWSTTRVKAAADDSSTSQLQDDSDLLLLELINAIEPDQGGPQ